jgi:hypothetical protein
MTSGIVGLGVDDDELVVNVYGGRPPFVFPFLEGGSVLLLLISTSLNSGKNPAGVSPGLK